MEMMLFAEMRAVTGNMSENEIAAYQSSIYLNIAMQFKTWMPGKFQNWIGEARYDRQLKRMTEGKYRGSLAAAFAREEIISDDLDMADKLKRMGETGLHAIKTLIDTSHYTLSSQEREKLIKEKKWPQQKEDLYQARKKRLMAEFNVFRSNTTVPGLVKTSNETEAEAVTLDLNEQRKENEGNPFRKNSNGDEPSANTGGSPEQDAEKSPLNVVA